MTLPVARWWVIPYQVGHDSSKSELGLNMPELWALASEGERLIVGVGVGRIGAQLRGNGLSLVEGREGEGLLVEEELARESDL